MPIGAKLQADNLAFFVDARLLPEISAASKDATHSDRTLRIRSNGALFECVAWLDLGVRLGYFDRKSSNEVLRSHFSALIPTDELDLQAVRSLFFRLPGLFDGFRSRKALIEAVKPQFDEPDKLLFTFRTAHLIATSWAQDGLAQTFSAALNFASDTIWDRIVRDARIDPGQVFLALNLQDGPIPDITSETVFAGFLRTLEHMSVSRQLSTSLGDLGLNRDDLVGFKRATRNIQFWRVNLRDQIGRFREIREFVSKGIADDLATRDPKGNADSAFFVEEVQALVDYWLEDDQQTPLTRSAGA
jgi:hypothetical protein